MKRPARFLALVLTMALVAAACGSDDDADSGVDTDAVTTGDDATEDQADDGAMEEEGNATEDQADDEATGDGAMEDEEAVADTLLGLAITSIDFETEKVVITNNSAGEIDLDGFFLCSFPAYGKIEGVGVVAPSESVTVVSPVALSASAGELGLYTIDSYSDPDAIQAYVEWGTPDHERASVAIEAGIYDGTPLVVEGNTLIAG